MSIASYFPVGEKRVEINGSKVVDVVAADKIQIGDTIYTVEGDPAIKGIFYYKELSRLVKTATFSPDGSTLVLGGGFTGYAKVYSVNGTNITYVSDIYADGGTTALSNTVNTAAFSPDGTTLALGGDFTGYAKVYSVSGTAITYVSDIYRNAGTTALNSTVKTATFSPDGSILVLGGYFSGYAKAYSVNGTTITYVRDIYRDAQNVSLNTSVSTSTFSPDGKVLILGGAFTGRAKIYSVKGTNITYVSDIYEDAGGTSLSGGVEVSVFSPGGSVLVIGGQFTGRAKIYSVSGTTITYVSDIYADAGTTALNGTVRTAAFSPDGTTLALGGDFTGFTKVYSVNGTNITYVSDIYANVGAAELDSSVLSSTFSPDGTTLVLGGNFADNAKVYSVINKTITYVSDIYAEMSSGYVRTATFSPDGSILVLGGKFTGYAKVYSVNGTTITYVSDIFIGTWPTMADRFVSVSTFSPDGSTLVLGGSFTGYAKVYSVSGTTITYVSDIYTNVGNTALSNTVYAAAFSPDGTALALGGGFTGRAKIYSVSGTTITYVSDVYADAGSTALSNTVLNVTFSPDGSMLVLGGNFTGFAKFYSSIGTTITYISDIYADAGATVLDKSVRAITFSPDGSVLVIGGQFTGCAKVYSVNGTNIIYVDDIYADAGTTALNNTASIATFSPDGSILFLGGLFTGYAKSYSVNGTTITYVNDIYAGAGTTALSSYVNAAAFSPDGTALALGGNFTGYAMSKFSLGNGIFSVLDLAHRATGGIVPVNQNMKIGFSKANIETGNIGSVKLIVEAIPGDNS